MSSTPEPTAATTWPETAMAAAESTAGYHVRIAMRLYAVAMLTELIYDVRRSHSLARDSFAELLEAKITHLRKLNGIDRLQHQSTEEIS
jgi:hypothetical protein